MEESYCTRAIDMVLKLAGLVKVKRVIRNIRVIRVLRVIGIIRSIRRVVLYAYDRHGT